MGCMADGCGWGPQHQIWPKQHDAKQKAFTDWCKICCAFLKKVLFNARSEAIIVLLIQIDKQNLEYIHWSLMNTYNGIWSCICKPGNTILSSQKFGKRVLSRFVSLKYFIKMLPSSNAKGSISSSWHNVEKYTVVQLSAWETKWKVP